MRAETHLEEALKRVVAEKGWQWPEKAVIEPPKDRKFGDMSANVAMLLAGQARKNPRELAQELAEAVEAGDPDIVRAEVAGPGFLNVHYSLDFWKKTIRLIEEQAERFGFSDMGKGRKVQVEYVSANPTGPLHIGHGRGAALGDSLARILRSTGHDVETEYYVNDAGRQMKILGNSIWVRLLQDQGRDIPDPDDFYKGEYIKDLSREVLELHPGILDMAESEAVDICRQYGMGKILEGIKTDLEQFGVEHQVWFSEKSLVQNGKVEETFESLKKAGLAYDKDGALWFRSTDFGDDKDRVLRKSSGDITYFASDIAYHHDKFKRGFDLVVDIWGADHHGYVPRMQAACEALGRKGGLQVILVQLVNLLRGGEQVAMSTRGGQFETLKDVVDEVGPDAARFIFLSRKSDSKLDFDLELVKQRTMDNPVYYVQYAHARICSLMHKAGEEGFKLERSAPELLEMLDTEEDRELLMALDRFPDSVEASARTLSPHLISFYLQELASKLHKYYTTHHVLSAEPLRCKARMILLGCVARVVGNGLSLLGVDAPERM